jgi:sec-independent protein translocase protein TatB
MFEISFQELLLVALVALLVLGPERLPGALRTLGLWLGRLRRSFDSVKQEIEREIGMDDVRRQLHNELVMGELKRIESDLAGTPAVAGVDKPADTPSPSADAGVDKPVATSASPAAADVDTPADTPAKPALAGIDTGARDA